MSVVLPDTAEELRGELTALIVRRLRLGVRAFLAGVVLFVIADHSLMAAVPRWADVLNVILIGLAAIILWFSNRPVFRAHVVPFGLLIVAMICWSRALAGIWTGDLVPTAIVCLVVALTAGASLPWGVWAQLGSVVIAGLAIASNAFLITGTSVHGTAQLIAAVFTALMVSVILSFELRRHHARLIEENIRRRRAEDGLARLNAELESRVVDRTAELRRSEAALSALVENTTDAVWSVDRKGVVTVMNAVAQRRFRERFGVECDRLNYGAQIGEPIRTMLAELFERAFRGEHVQVESAMPGDGGERHFLLSIHPIVENGVVTGATAFSKDITERKHAEEQARQHQAHLAHVLRLNTMGEMAAGFAHEINQPLGAIANYAQGCTRRLREGAIDGAGLLPIIEEMGHEALRAGEIIRRLRDLVRKEDPQQAPVDLNALIRESTRIIEPEALQSGIRVELALAPDLPPVTCDSIQIEQVLLNLLLNGVEAMQTSGNGERSLTITTAAAGTASIEVAIRDSGNGVPDPPADVFKPLFSTKPNGLGMGLSISRSIIEAHGGRLWAARNADHGSTFRFTLPLERAQAA